ncbi:UNVERIFIED_CONTAM: rhoptry neck protein RON2 [Hammondia hammondi]|eukprot:XP_008888401.1 rhoptry neck protein RON2 [Hammondia hammondi]
MTRRASLPLGRALLVLVLLSAADSLFFSRSPRSVFQLFSSVLFTDAAEPDSDATPQRRPQPSPRTSRPTGYQRIEVKTVDEELPEDLKVYTASTRGSSSRTFEFRNAGGRQEGFTLSVLTAGGPLPHGSWSWSGTPPEVQTTGGSQISFGWVPDTETPSLPERNLLQLKRMLRDEGFIEAVQLRAAEKGCPVAVLHNLRQLPVNFREVLHEEYESRSNPAKMYEVANSYVQQRGSDAARWSVSQSVELSLLEIHATSTTDPRGSSAVPSFLETGPQVRVAMTDAVPSEIRVYATPPAPRPVPVQSNQTEKERSPTSKRLVGMQLGLYLICKLAALFGHPTLFLNPHYTEQQLLEAVAQALGIAPPHRSDFEDQENETQATANQHNGSADQLLAAIEIFRLGPNPYTIGHVLTLMIGYLDYESFFGASPSKPFHSWVSLAASAGNNTGFAMLDEMCDNHRGPKRRGQKHWYQTGGARKHKSRDMLPLHRQLCDALELVLNGVQQIQIDLMDELGKYKTGVEPLVDPATNSARIHTRTCRGLSPVCDYEATILAPVRSLEPHEQQDSLRTKKAFNLVTGYGSGHVGQITGSIAEPFSHSWRTRWGKVVGDPTAYGEIFERTMWFDDRELMAKNSGALFRQYDRIAKDSMAFGVFMNAENGLLKKDMRTKLEAYISQRKTFVEKRQQSRFAKLRKKVPENDPFALRTAIFLALNSRTFCTQTTSFLSSFRTFLANQYNKLSQGRNLPRSQRSLMAFMRTGQVKFFQEWCGFDPLAVNALFLFRFAVSGTDPAALNDRQHTRVSRNKKTMRILNSKWTPAVMKKLMRKINHKHMAREAKALLLRSLDPTVLSSIVTAFDFITHTQANLEVNQNAFMYHEVQAREVSRQSAADKASHQLHARGLVRETDDMIKKWAEHGIPADIKRRLARGEKLPEGMSFGGIPIPNLTNWDAQLNSKWLDAYNAYLRHPYGRAALNARDPVALLVKDSRDRLQAEGESTIFLGRIAKRVHRSRNLLLRAGRALKTFFLSLLRENERSEYAVWFGVKVDMRQVIQTCRQINAVAEVVKNDRLYDFITDGWLELVKDVVAGYTKASVRVPGFDTISAANEQLRKEGMAAATARNQGFLSIHYDYANLPEEERKKEFQRSMCMEQCEALWKLVMAFVMPNLQNPKRLKGYEKDFSGAKEIEKLNSPHHVNAFRFSLSVQIDFFDNMLDKTSKKNLKAMKFGASTWFAYAMKLAGQVNSEMGNPNLGTALYMQAAYYGNYIRKWMEERRKSRKQAILGVLTLGMMGLYALLNVADIVQHMEDIGGAPPVSCVTNEILGVTCAPQAIAKATTSAAKVATQDFLKVGLFAGMAPYLMLPMAVVSVWNILKSEIKVLLQFEMALKHTFTRLKRWLAAPFKNWWAKRGRLKDALFRRASQTYRKTEQETKQPPRPRNLHNPSSWGDTELDSLGVPPEPFVQEFEIKYTTPVFPMSAPLIKV